MSRTLTREQLCTAGARNLRDFGYPDAKPENVMTIWLFAQFFKRMLEETLENMPSSKLTIQPMLDEIAQLKQPGT